MQGQALRAGRRRRKCFSSKIYAEGLPGVPGGAHPVPTLSDRRSCTDANCLLPLGDDGVTAPATLDNRRPVSESAERFLRAVLGDVPLERVAEVHLFPSLRQGQYETGVAVIAAWSDQVPVAEREASRPTVYTARYRLVIKGPDRGRWEFECTAEADAPLITVETVVRGVQRRSGDLEDPVRYDADALAHVLRIEPDTPASDSDASDVPAPDVSEPDPDVVEPTA